MTKKLTIIENVFAFQPISKELESLGEPSKPFQGPSIKKQRVSYLNIMPYVMKKTPQSTAS